jgi:hypothetical protein
LHSRRRQVRNHRRRYHAVSANIVSNNPLKQNFFSTKTFAFHSKTVDLPSLEDWFEELNCQFVEIMSRETLMPMMLTTTENEENKC